MAGDILVVMTEKLLPSSCRKRPGILLLLRAYRTAPRTKDYQVPNVSSAQVRKPCIPNKVVLPPWVQSLVFGADVQKKLCTKPHIHTVHKYTVYLW